MIEKIQKLRKHPYYKQLRDVRVLGLIVFAGLALLVSWNGIAAIQTNYELQKQISQLQQERDVKQLENTNLKLRNEYFNTDQFLELAARRQFGKAAPGEKVLLVPKTVALAHTVSLTSDAKPVVKTQVHKSQYQRNFEAWMNFFMHRQTDI
jgi:cell division protein FtsB